MKAPLAVDIFAFLTDVTGKRLTWIQTYVNNFMLSYAQPMIISWPVKQDVHTSARNKA
jgi:hypothetical protein